MYTTAENEYLDTLEELCVEKVDRVKKIESLENRIAHELYMIKTLEERMSKMSKKYHQDVVGAVEAYTWTVSDASSYCNN